MWASEPNFTREDLARVRVPLLVLDGDADEAIDTEHTRQMAEWIPTAELTLIPGTGHFAMWEKPDETNNVLLEFLSRTSDPALTDFATRYAAAWSSQEPVSLASFYAEDGSLIVNGGEPSTGRAAIAATARSFMEAFPDMVVMLERVEGDAGHATFHWRWTGTNTGPGGTGNAVDLTGYEKWTLDDDGLILESNGHYDAAEYERQVNGETGFGDE
jgi:uncharacterized protein (TIGR02246 family)